jgi:hypothetical protein
MFYLHLALIFEEYNSGRMDIASYIENIILMAEDHERLKAQEDRIPQAA